jgi:hypothetical protein
MDSIKKRIFAAAIIAGLAVIGSLMNSQQSTVRAAGGPTVTIDQAQLPLPVQGSLGVSGTVAATQSGNWNVGITGTPNVHVTNPATAPALTLDISKSASRHVQLICGSLGGGNGVTCNPASADGTFSGTTYVVPAGESLVVTSVDMFTFATSGGNSSFHIGAGIGGNGWIVPFDGLTHSFQYPSGIVFPTGFTFDNSEVTVGGAPPIVKLQGFLTPI